MYPPFSLDQLTAFVTVVEEGSFSAAGRRLGRVQSAISYAVAQLEQSVGSPLFDRSGRTPALTEAGRRLLGEARLVLAQAWSLSELAAGLRAGVEAELRVAVDALYPQTALAALCGRFREVFPATALRVDVGLLGDALAEVVEGRAELGACNLTGPPAEHLAVSHLGTVSVVPVCAAHHPLAGAPGPQRQGLLRQHVQIVQSERSRGQTRDQGVLGARTWRVTELSLKLALILEGVGWGSVPAPLARGHLASGRLVRLHPEPWPAEGHTLDLHAVTLQERPLGPAGQWFREALSLGG